MIICMEVCNGTEGGCKLIMLIDLFSHLSYANAFARNFRTNIPRP
jgi:hypothetical protein